LRGDAESLDTLKAPHVMRHDVIVLSRDRQFHQGSPQMNANRGREHGGKPTQIAHGGRALREVLA